MCKTEELSIFLEKICDVIWGPALLALVLGTGIFLTVISGFFPIRRAGFIFKNSFGKVFESKSAFSATATALGATVGTGNIIGVASAIAIGGPGAVFWMWVGAVSGMMLKFAEASLAVKFCGGAAKYIEKAFGGRPFAVLWCVCCVFASFGGGNMVQTNAAASAFKNAFGTEPIVIGAAIALLTAAVIFCGAKAVMNISSFLVPFMAAVYVIGCMAVIFTFRQNLWPAIENIFSSAFEPASFGGGIGGLLLSRTLKTGIAKGTFTHEAGMGSASLAHCEGGKDPLLQGCWGIAEVFIDTVFVCSLTAFVLLSSGIKDITENSAAEIFFENFGVFGKIFLCFSMFLFALAAVIGWAFYGEKALGYITKSKTALYFYRTVFCLAAAVGSVTGLPLIWSITDIFNGLMIFPNLAAIIVLSPKVLKITKAPRQ